jgi:hypothetical protein
MGLVATGLATAAAAQSGKPGGEGPAGDPGAPVAAAQREVSRAPFQQYVFADCSDGRIDCTLDFDVVPASSRLEIQNVSCHIEYTPSLDVRASQLLVLRPNLSIASASTLVPTFVSTPLRTASAGVAAEGSYHVYAANHAVFVFASAGRRFQAFFRKGQGGTFLLVACHISGHMVKLG